MLRKIFKMGEHETPDRIRTKRRRWFYGICACASKMHPSLQMADAVVPTSLANCR